MNIMNKMFRVSMWNNSVDEYAKIKTSDKSIWFINSRGKEERELLVTKDYAWFDSRIDAYEWKKSKLEFEVKCKQDTLNYYQKKLDDFISSNGI